MKSTITQTVRKISTACGFMAGIGLPFMFIGCTDETFHVTAKDYEELRDTGMIQRYWLPDTMPKSVRDVKFSGDVENSSGKGTFFVAPDDIDDLTKGFDLLPSSDSADVSQYMRKQDDQFERMTVNTTTGFVQWSTGRR